MHNLPIAPYGMLAPTWGNRLPRPGGVLPPPPAPVELAELAAVRQLNARAIQSPQAVQFTEFLDKQGGYGLWKDFAKQYRKGAGFVRGWLGTGLLHVALGVNAIETWNSKRHYDRLRPYEVDANIRPIGKAPTNGSYPSGHASGAYAGATVMSILWPARAHEFQWWARQVGLSRMHAGVHFPSDVVTGARLGQRSALNTMSILA
jgi:membrane-associated phospholipid phosphatase